MSSYHLLHLMYLLLHHNNNHVHFMFKDTSSSSLSNQKQRYAGFSVSFSTKPNSEREIKPARDRVIDFGKHKGKMLGTLPSNYLKWVSKNLRTLEFKKWAILADEVLVDPIYKDRIEWEFADNVLNGNNKISSVVVARSNGAASELQEISERFGWDFLDKVGWSQVDFNLLGTSKGGRIPRRVNNHRKFDAEPKQTHTASSTGMSSSSRNSSRSKRMERRERQKMRLRNSSKHEEEDEAETEEEDKVGEIEDVGDNVAVNNPFPGRQAFLRKAIDHRTILN